jgi:glycosyltransferase involved in cell wall biosynthesis
MLQSNKVPGYLRPLLAKVVDMLELFLSRFADCIITADNNISHRFVDIHHSVTPVFNYPRLSVFVPDEQKLLQLQERYRGRTPIIYQGGISIQRGLFQMIEAMNMVKSSRPDILLLLVGPIGEGLLEQAKSKIDCYNLQNHVEIVGCVPHTDVVNYILISKLGLIPFLPTKKFSKNIPIKQFEYMICGVPAVGANLPPIESYIEAAGSGRTYDATSFEALAEAIVDTLNNDTEYMKMSVAGKKAIHEMWNWDEEEKKLFQLYEKLLPDS